MIVMNNLKANAINEEVKINVDSGITVISDAYNGYNKLKLIVKKHEVINTKELKTTCEPTVCVANVESDINIIKYKF